MTTALEDLKAKQQEWRRAVEDHVVTGKATVPESVADCADELEPIIQKLEQERVREGGDSEADAPGVWGECLYCGEPVRLPAKYCCLEHEEHRSLQ